MPASAAATTFTDYVLAGVSLGFAVVIGRRLTPQNRVSAWFWCAAFVASAIAGAAGGTFHGFAAQFEVSTVRDLWNLTMFSMGACGAFVVAGVHAADVRRTDGTVTWLVAAAAVTILGAAIQQRILPTPAAWNPNAAYHLIQIAGLYCLFRCARTARDRPGMAPRA